MWFFWKIISYLIYPMLYLLKSIKNTMKIRNLKTIAWSCYGWGQGRQSIASTQGCPIPSSTPHPPPFGVLHQLCQGMRSRAAPAACWLTFQHLAELFSSLLCELFICVKAFMQIQAFQRTNVGKAVGNFGVVMEYSCGCNRKCLYWWKQDEGWGRRKEK